MRRNENLCLAMTVRVLVKEGKGGTYLAQFECDQQNCRCVQGGAILLRATDKSRSPHCDSARKLIALGFRPDVRLEMWREGAEAAHFSSSIGEAARLRVKTSGSGRPIFVSSEPAHLVPQAHTRILDTEKQPGHGVRSRDDVEAKGAADQAASDEAPQAESALIRRAA